MQKYILSLLIVAGLLVAAYLVLKEQPLLAPQEPLEDNHLVTGVFSLGPYEEALVETQLASTENCPNGMPPNVRVGGTGLCKVEDWNLSLDTTWANPDIVGVLVRLPWNQVQLAPGTEDRNFDFTALDHELNQAVKYNKSMSLVISAGDRGTPDWLFTEGGVQGYDFEDSGDDLATDKCGLKLHLGNPTDPAYQQHYFDMLHKTFEHIKTRNEWVNALAYIKISGANLITSEARLPSRCKAGCICNTQVWAEAGYTPSGLHDFYLQQMDLIQQDLPGKYMGYMLIQGGWPKVNDQGDYEMANGQSSGGEIKGSGVQVTEFIGKASERFGDLFVVSHNGLGPIVTDRPNPWVLKAGEAGQPTTFQTQNNKKVPDPAALQETLENLWENSDAFMLEAYEDVLWEAYQNGNELVPDNQAETNTLAEWNEELRSRVE